MDESDVNTGLSSRASSLRPPLLFRSVGPPGLLAGLPPHRRLRSLFCRSSAVLPTATRTPDASHGHAFTDELARRAIRSLDRSDASNALEMDPEPHRRLACGSKLSPDPQSRSEQQDKHLLSYLRPPAAAAAGGERLRGRQAGLVTPTHTPAEPVMKDQQQLRRRKRSYKVDCAGRHRYLVPSLTEKEEAARLCEWLHSLGIADSDATGSSAKKSQRRQPVSRSRRTPGHRTDRRPHFLPPICQTDSLLHVPLLLPENSPPPSPYIHPDAPVRPLTVPPPPSIAPDAEEKVRSWKETGTENHVRLHRNT